MTFGWTAIHSIERWSRPQIYGRARARSTKRERPLREISRGSVRTGARVGELHMSMPSPAPIRSPSSSFHVATHTSGLESNHWGMVAILDCYRVYMCEVGTFLFCSTFSTHTHMLRMYRKLDEWCFSTYRNSHCVNARLHCVIFPYFSPSIIFWLRMGRIAEISAWSHMYAHSNQYVFSCYFFFVAVHAHRKIRTSTEPLFLNNRGAFLGKAIKYLYVVQCVCLCLSTMIHNRSIHRIWISRFNRRTLQFVSFLNWISYSNV